LTYVSLYRKWRPQTFDEIAGQSHVTQTLKNAIERGRVSHAYLFCGPRGTGKTTTARILAKAINCVEGPTVKPCGNCDSCRSITDGNSIDVLELDAASNRKVDEIRDFLEKIPYSSAQGGKKVYIVDEVHMLTTESFNTLLKTLEEPPEHVVFILATTEPNKVLPTILSRCQRFDFMRISVPDIEERLRAVAKAEEISIDDAALTLIAHHVQGAMRDALGILEQLASYAKEQIAASDVTMLLGVTDSEVLYGFTSMLASGDLAGGLLFVEDRVAKGHDIRQFMQDMLGYLRDLYLVQSVNGIRPASITDELWERFEEQAAGINSRSLLFYINTLNELYNQSRWSTDVRLQLEIALFKMIKTGDDVTVEGLLHRIERLENALMSGGRLPRDVSPDKALAGAEQTKEVIWVKPQAKTSGRAQERPDAGGKDVKKPKHDRDTGIETVGDDPAAATTVAITASTESEELLRNSVTAATENTAKSEAIVEGAETPGDTTSPVSIEMVQKYWPQVLKLIKEKKRARYHFFAAAKVKRIENGKLVLAIKAAERQFIENPENLQLLRSALKIASGIDVQIICEPVRDNVKTVAVTDSVDANAEHDEVLAIGDYIKMVQDTFGAKIVEDISLED
jgi:DNA polymerase-3 subunit gamma/tau